MCAQALLDPSCGIGQHAAPGEPYVVIPPGGPNGEFHCTDTLLSIYVHPEGLTEGC